MNKFFTRHAFKVILVVIFVLPFMTRGTRLAFKSNNNRVQDWLPKEYPETQSFQWFKRLFENETFILVSWEGCTLNDDRLELLARKLVPDPENLAEDALYRKVETGSRLFERLTEKPLSLSEDEALRRLKGLFVGPKAETVEATQSCAIITLTETGKRDFRKTVKDVRRMTKDELGLDPDRVHMGGPPVDEVAIAEEGERTLIRLFGPAAIVGVGLAFWCLRSVRLTTMVFATALYAGAVSLSVVYYSSGTMNAILLTMPAVVYVAGISGAIHFANYYRDSAVEEGIEGAPARAVKHAWLPCTLSAVTTAAGLVSLYTSELTPIKMFGIYSAAGVIATLLLLFIFLPSWMQLWPMKKHSALDGAAPSSEDLALPARWRRFLDGGVLGHHRLVFAGLVALMIFCGIGVTKLDTSIKLTKMFSPDARIIHDYEWLEANLGPLVPMEVIVRFDNTKCKLNTLERMQLLRRVQDKLETVQGATAKGEPIQAIGNTMSAVTFAPSLEVKRAGPFIPKTTMARILDGKLADHLEEYSRAGFRAVEGDEELWRISARVGALNDIDYGAFIHDIENAIDPMLKEENARLAGLERKAREKAAGVKMMPISVSGSEASGDDVSTGEVADMGVAATYTGLVPLVYKAQREMLTGLAWNFVTDLLTIAVVVTIVFWDITAGLILLLPSVFPVLIVFGLMGWMGIVIDVGTIMTPTVALGVSVDDIVHFLIWYRRGLAEGKTRREATMLAYEGCARAMYQSWSVLGLGLAVFSLSAFVPTQRFGALMFTLLTAALVGNLLLMPTVLISPLSMFFGRRLMRRAKAHPELPPVGEEFPDDLDPPSPLSHIHRRDASHRSVRT